MRTGSSWSRIADPFCRIEFFAGLIVTKKMIGESSALGVCGIVTRAMRRSVAEKEHAACFELNRVGFGFIGKAADVMIAVSVALVRKKGVE